MPQALRTCVDFSTFSDSDLFRLSDADFLLQHGLTCNKIERLGALAKRITPLSGPDDYSVRANLKLYKELQSSHPNEARQYLDRAVAFNNSEANQELQTIRQGERLRKFYY